MTHEDSAAFYQLITAIYANITIGFEVDFLDYEYGEFGAFVNGYDGVLNLSQQWIQGINDANAKVYVFPFSRRSFGCSFCVRAQLNQSVQFCMSLPSYLLSSLALPAVTNVRASEDNFPAEHNRWKVAYSSLLISALQLKPFFDVIWTTSTQPGNAYGVRSMDVELQAVISLLMAGPFGIGDGVNMTNSTIVAAAAPVDVGGAHRGDALRPRQPGGHQARRRGLVRIVDSPGLRAAQQLQRAGRGQSAPLEL